MTTKMLSKRLGEISKLEIEIKKLKLSVNRAKANAPHAQETINKEALLCKTQELLKNLTDWKTWEIPCPWKVKQAARKRNTVIVAGEEDVYYDSRGYIYCLDEYAVTVYSCTQNVFEGEDEVSYIDNQGDLEEL